ncbi:MAG: heme A synthase [Pseudomonadota bacterium]
MAEKRKLFEDVDAAPAQPVAAAGGLIARDTAAARFWTRLWLCLLFGLVVLMIAVGGLTRLTDSGLSITEWAPVTGALPPMSDADWQSEFEKYRQIPEYQLQNKGMSLAEFKVIYWWEWGHRQLGRVIGLVWAVGFLVLLVARKVPAGWTPRLLGLGALGGLQGAIGWWMVSSGLSGEMLDVASYRLAVHLGLAFIILGLIAWYINRLGRDAAHLLSARRAGDAKLFGMGTGLMHFAFLQILIGALVAGIDAGRSFTDWPLMGGGIIPERVFDMTPWWRNLFENAGFVQFTHRTVGYLFLIYAVVVWRVSRRSGNFGTRRAFDWVLVMTFGQIVIGIGTVLYAAPLEIAVFHQLGAVVLWVLVLRARFLARYPKDQSVRGAAV